MADRSTPKGSCRWRVLCALVVLALLRASIALAQTAPDVKAFTPFRIIGNIYYVGDTNEAVYLITTAAGHILLDTGYAETVPIVQAGVEKLGFEMRDIRIMISGHAHSDLERRRTRSSIRSVVRGYVEKGEAAFLKQLEEEKQSRK